MEPSKAKGDLRSEISELRRDVRQQPAASSGKGEGHSEGGTKRKSRGSPDLSGTCYSSIALLHLMFPVVPKWIHLRGVPLVEAHLLGHRTHPPLPPSLCRISHLLFPLHIMTTGRRNGELESHLEHFLVMPVDLSVLLSSVCLDQENNIAYPEIGLHLNWIARLCYVFLYISLYVCRRT